MQQIFIVDKLSKRIFKVSWKVFLLDFIYKTNHYWILLYMISNIIDLNISFDIGFAFLYSEYIMIIFRFYYQPRNFIKWEIFQIFIL